jgi:hypothetical protein
MGLGGLALGPLVLIRSCHRGDAGIVEHELEHVRQWVRWGGIGFWLLYLFSPRHRYRWELQAFRLQLRHSPGEARAFALALATRYRLRLDVRRVLGDLLEERW